MELLLQSSLFLQFRVFFSKLGYWVFNFTPELQDNVVNLTRQLIELRARYHSTQNQLQTRMQALDQRELREKELDQHAEKLELKELEGEEHLVMLENSIEGFGCATESLEEAC
ncbi:hypothetical protein ACLB2K_011198 [Fragaria x ananassa]